MGTPNAPLRKRVRRTTPPRVATASTRVPCPARIATYRVFPSCEATPREPKVTPGEGPAPAADPTRASPATSRAKTSARFICPSLPTRQLHRSALRGSTLLAGVAGAEERGEASGDRRDHEDRPRLERDVHHLPGAGDRILHRGRDEREQSAELFADPSPRGGRITRAWTSRSRPLV